VILLTHGKHLHEIKGGFLMKIYSFWSGDTTYFTKSRSIKKAQSVGKENMELYLKTCEYLGEQPEADKDYFIPNEVEKVSKAWFNHLVKTDPDTLILDDELYSFLN
jgi:hypothetical protein